VNKSSFNISALNEFYQQVSANEGISVTDLQAKLRHLFEMRRSADDLTTYRFSRARHGKSCPMKLCQCPDFSNGAACGAAAYASRSIARFQIAGFGRPPDASLLGSR
jgi:hypothetical protein